MRIEIKRINDAFQMEAKNENGNTILLDSSEEAGGSNLGFRPMQLLLAGIGSCSTIDIIDILKKQRQHLKDIQVLVDGDREKDKVPALWQKIHLHYILTGDLEEDKVKKALDLSINKYCSVAKTLEKTAEITYTYQIKSN